MSGNLSSLGLGGFPPTKQVINAFSGGGVSVATIAASSTTNMAKEYLSGFLSTGVKSAAIISLTGPGQASYCAAYSRDATSRSIQLEITIDGVVVFNPVSDFITATSRGVVAAGHGAATAVGPSEPLRWNSSFVAKVTYVTGAAAATETDKIGLALAAN